MENDILNVDISDDTIEALLIKYIEDTMSSASSELYQDRLAEGDPAFTAAGHAVFNECMVDIIKYGIERAKSQSVKDKQINCEHVMFEYMGHGHDYSMYRCDKCGYEEER